jgi:hypothetical protein
VLAKGNENGLKPLLGWDKALSSSVEDIAIAQFHYTTMKTLPHAEDHARYIHSLLPELYNRSGNDSPLRLATQAISYATLSKSGRETAQLSRKRYVKAIRAVNAAIRDPLQVKSDNMLYAVLLLCGYEVSLP